MHFIKDPDESLDYGFDLEDWLSAGDTINSAVWTITDESGGTADTSFTFVPGDVTPGSDIITIVGHTFLNNDRVTFTTDTTLPSGIIANKGYHIVNVSGNIFQIALTRGGTPVSIVTSGTGIHTVTRTLVNDGNLLATPITSVFVGGGTISKTYKISVHAITASTPPRTFDRGHTIEIREK
jgi:hypothetical protein